MQELKEEIKALRAENAALKKAAAAPSSKLPRSPTGSPSHRAGHLGHVGFIETADGEEYLALPFYRLAWRRVGWLFVFLISLSTTALAMSYFEHTLAKQLELAYFVPLLIGHGGNAGGQTVGAVLSALGSGKVRQKHAFQVIMKEFFSAAVIGTILGLATAVGANVLMSTPWHVAVAVGFTLPLLSILACSVASALPFGCMLLGLDAAVIAAPAMTTVVDVLGLVSYFMTAQIVFRTFGYDF